MFLNFHVFILFVLVCILYCVLMFLCYLLYVTQCFQDIIPYVDHGVQQKDSHQSEAISEHVKDQVEPGNVAFVGAASGTGSEVPVDAPKKHEVKKSRAKKKKAAAGDSGLPNPPVRRTRRYGVKSVASKGPSPSIAEEPVIKSTSFSDVVSALSFSFYIYVQFLFLM
ncbi:hypothetical protein CsatB_014553 [Cannabis sativa]